jgi:hypothetical protein
MELEMASPKRKRSGGMDRLTSFIRETKELLDQLNLALKSLTILLGRLFVIYVLLRHHQW